MTKNTGLVTDFYQLTMAQGLWRIGAHEVPCVFDRTYRTNPFGGGYTVVAGVEHLLDFIENFRYGPEELEYLRKAGFAEDFLAWLADFRFAGDIYAMPEGTVAFPGEVLVRVEAPKVHALLVETGLTMILNHESLIATKARRVREVAGEDFLMEFGLRRAQGESAGHFGARAAMVGGFNGTSNVEAARRFGMPAIGTMAHSWVMSFDEELEAFREYTRQYEQAVLLVDTYHTLESGVPHAIQVFEELRQEGRLPENHGIRLDSGDLACLSREARKMLDAAGFPNASITASNDLDEYLVRSLKEQGAAIDAWGIGTKLITADGAGALGGVYKLAAQVQDGVCVPKMKFSDNPEKMTNPGVKEVYRIYDAGTKKIITDVVCLQGEEVREDLPYEVVDPKYRWRKKSLQPGSFYVKSLLQPVLKKGKRLGESPTLAEVAAYAQKEIDSLRREYKRFENPEIMEVNLSAKLKALKAKLVEENMRHMEEKYESK